MTAGIRMKNRHKSRWDGEVVMTEHEKVIKGLECCAFYFHERQCRKCPYFPDYQDCRSLLIQNAKEILKAQKPRVLTLEEIRDGESYWFSAGKEFAPRPIICVHREDDARTPHITFLWQFGMFSWRIEDYGKRWICWTARPTEEQMKAVKWE